MTPIDEIVQLSKVSLHIRRWEPEKALTGAPEFILLHGLSSNARTWDKVAAGLASAGYLTIAVDQRGHGLSSKPDSGYGFEAITSDLRELVTALGLERVILAGQSWGGNVILEAASRYPELAAGLVFVDGGFLDLKARGEWEEIEIELRPPPIAGMPKQEIINRISEMHPGWIPDGVEMTLGNFKILEDETVQPWLQLDNHMAILRALYDQDVHSLYPRVEQHVVICAADDGTEWTERKKVQVGNAKRLLPSSEVHWFPGAAHDIHVDQPEELTANILRSVVNFS